MAQKLSLRCSSRMLPIGRHIMREEFVIDQ